MLALGVIGNQEIFATYLAHLTSYSAYGVAGGFLGLATWIYLSSQIIFFGAQLTSVHTRQNAEVTRDARKSPARGEPAGASTP